MSLGGALRAARRQRDSLRAAGHRPYPLPARPWVNGQTWEHLLFAHWSVDPQTMAGLVPAGLEVDLFDGRAWLTIAPFRLCGFRAHLLPPLPGVHTFLETNVRTYVRRGGLPGIYFFSLDATSRLAVEGARLAYDLPYRYARGRIHQAGGAIDYRLERADPAHGPARLHASYRARGPAREAAAGSLEQFLVERYCLFAAGKSGRIMRTDIHHAPWRIHDAEAEVRQAGLVPAGVEPLVDPPLLQVAGRQDVVVWWPVAA
jgi:uncharacterized protein YqjF (DUF2071 family)